jgi:hypothetical protein
LGITGEISAAVTAEGRRSVAMRDVLCSLDLLLDAAVGGTTIVLL